MPAKDKRSGLGLDIRSFQGKDGENYIVLKTTKGSYHVFQEVEAKEAARKCGVTAAGNTRRLWGKLWKDASV
jgi:hypothetical protein